jgi:hypothetical protein
MRHGSPLSHVIKRLNLLFERLTTEPSLALSSPQTL